MDSILKDLEKYGVSKLTGFVPDTGSRQLPHHYQAWEDLVATLSTRLATGDKLLAQVASLPAFSLGLLCEKHQWQRAYIVLAFLLHAVVHGLGQITVSAKLAVPFVAVCHHIGVQPVLSYVGLCLYNWSENGDQGVLGGLRSEMSFTGTLDEAAFYLVPVLVELAGGHLPNVLARSLIAAAEGDWNVVTHDLHICLEAIVAMSDALAQLSLCNPQIFYQQIRPYIAGIDVAFLTADDVPLQIKQTGGSAVQSSLFMFLDHVLGVRHESPIMKDMRIYMPRGHRQFLEDIEAQPSLPELMEGHDAASEAQSKLVECRQELRRWRSKHIAIVTRYIVLPAQAAAGPNKDAVRVTGTAGSSPLPFLKQNRDDTTL